MQKSPHAGFEIKDFSPKFVFSSAERSLVAINLK